MLFQRAQVTLSQILATLVATQAQNPTFLQGQDTTAPDASLVTLMSAAPNRESWAGWKGQSQGARQGQ